MSENDITVVVAAHPARLRGGLLSRALTSVMNQSLPPAAISIAVDLRKEGAAATRQRALDAVQTPWMAVIDSDDVWMPHHLRCLMDHALDKGADYVYSGHESLPPGHSPLPLTHYQREFNYDDPIETTVTVLCRTGLAKQARYEPLNRGETNSGEDFRFLLKCMELGAVISCYQGVTWYYDIGTRGQNTSGLPGRGDAR
jgi:hypothetical protein